MSGGQRYDYLYRFLHSVVIALMGKAIGIQISTLDFLAEPLTIKLHWDYRCFSCCGFCFGFHFKDMKRNKKNTPNEIEKQAIRDKETQRIKTAKNRSSAAEKESVHSNYRYECEISVHENEVASGVKLKMLKIEPPFRTVLSH